MVLVWMMICVSYCMLSHATNTTPIFQVKSNIKLLLMCDQDSKMFKHLKHTLEIMEKLNQVTMENVRVACDTSTWATGRGRRRRGGHHGGF